MFYSYDVFDTLITRKTATPAGIFQIVQSKLINLSQFSEIPEYIKNNYVTIRKKIEKDLGRVQFISGTIEEISLDDIYNEIATNYCLPLKSIELIKKCEIDTEFENVIGISENIQSIKSKIRNGDKIILISDMYLSKDTIQKMLTSIDEIFLTIPLYVSSEIKLSKRTGNLYKYISQKENVKFSEWEHVGNDWLSDAVVPHKIGIKTSVYSTLPLLSFEKHILEKYPDNLTAQILIGAACAIRRDNRSLSSLEIIGCSLSAQLLYFYVSHVISSAQNNHISDLYFIARDGFILKKIAEKILSKSNNRVELHYIYGSRQAWRIHEINELLNNEDMNTVFYLSSIEDLADYFSIDENFIYKLLPEKYRHKSRKFSREDIQSIISSLLNNSEFTEKLSIVIDNKKDLLTRYFIQEVDFEKEIAFVDLYGTGKSISNVTRILKGILKDSIHTYYLSGRCSKGINDFTKIHMWQLDLPLGGMLEILCRAPHGQTTGYREEKGIIRPILDSRTIEYTANYDYYIETVMSCSEIITDIITSIPSFSLDIAIFYEYFRLFTRYPDSITVKTLSNLPYSSSSGAGKKLFAPKRGLIPTLYDYYRYRNIGYSTGSITYSFAQISPIHLKIANIIVDLYSNKSKLASYISNLGLVRFIFLMVSHISS